MATFEMTTHPLAFAHMEGGVKTVYLLPNVGGISNVTSGDRIEFEELGSIDVGMVRRYATLEEAVEREGFANVIPESADIEGALGSIRQSSDWDDAAAREHGVLALRVRAARRKG